MTRSQFFYKVRTAIVVERHESFSAHTNWWKFAVVFVLCAGATEILKTWPFFDAAAATVANMMQSRTDLNPKRKDVAIVFVTTTDLDNHFKERTVLPVQLAILITGIAKAGAAVVAVDFDTSHPSYKRLTSILSEIPQASRRIVWAVPPRESGNRNPVLDPEYKISISDKPEFLGDQVQRTSQFIAGEAVLRTKLGMVYEVPFDRNGRPTFVTRAVKLMNDRQVERSPAGDAPPAAESMARLYQVDDITAKDLFTEDVWRGIGNRSSDWKTQLRSAESVTEAAVGLLKDRLVFVGASYDAGDAFDTPWGQVPGVTLQASAASRLLEVSKGGAGGEWSAIGAKWSLKLGLALIVVYLFYRFTPATATILVFTVGTMVVLFSAYLAQYLHVFQLNIGPFLIGLWLEQTMEASLGHAQPDQ